MKSKSAMPFVVPISTQTDSEICDVQSLVEDVETEKRPSFGGLIWNLLKAPFIYTLSTIQIFIFYNYFIATRNKYDVVVRSKFQLFTEHPTLITMFTPVFLHRDLNHLIGNVSIQILYGVSLEIRHKRYKIMVLYILGAYAASIASCTVDMIYRNFTSIAGASGAIAALEGAQMIATYRNWSVESNFWWVWDIVLIFHGIQSGENFIFGIMIRYLFGINNEMADVTHMGGFLSGMVIGWWLLKYKVTGQIKNGYETI